jgi:DNA-binding NtrC family response regulator
MDEGGYAMHKSIMILDEDPVFFKSYQNIFERAGYHILMTSGRKSGLELLKKENPQAVFIEIRINGSPEEGLRFIEEALRERSNLTIVVVSREDNANIIGKALDRGATDYIVKSSADQIESHIEEVIRWIEDEIHLKDSVEKDGGLVIGPGKIIIGKSPKMLQVYALIEKVARNDARL